MTDLPHKLWELYTLREGSDGSAIKAGQSGLHLLLELKDGTPPLAILEAIAHDYPTHFEAFTNSPHYLRLCFHGQKKFEKIRRLDELASRIEEVRTWMPENPSGHITLGNDWGSGRRIPYAIAFLWPSPSTYINSYSHKTRTQDINPFVNADISWEGSVLTVKYRPVTGSEITYTHEL